jgi:hypothetical protein
MGLIASNVAGGHVVGKQMCDYVNDSSADEKFRRSEPSLTCMLRCSCYGCVLTLVIIGQALFHPRSFSCSVPSLVF